MESHNDINIKKHKTQPLCSGSFKVAKIILLFLSLKKENPNYLILINVKGNNFNSTMHPHVMGTTKMLLQQNPRSKTAASKKI